jgi:hypothetical protein
MMPWMFPAVGWGTFLLIHAISVPLVYGLGKACGAKKAAPKMIAEPEHL